MKKQVITVSRMYGSGGKELASKLAKALDVPYYDKEIFEIAAKESGIDVSLFNEQEALKTYRLGFHPLHQIKTLSLHGEMNAYTKATIEKVSQQPCVILGRGADSILKNREDVLHIFVYASLNDRIKRVKESYHIECDDYPKYILNIDENRQQYHDFYGEVKWGNKQNYALMINTSMMDIDDAVEMIKKYIENHS